MSTFYKVKWILGIFLIFAVIAATNLIDKGNFNRVKDSVVSIYEDRLTVSDIIFDISQLIHEKELALVLSDMDFYNTRNKKVNQDINSLIKRYENTVLTLDEKRIFTQLKSDFVDVEKSEAVIIESQSIDGSKALSFIGKMKSDLRELCKIQLSEGGKQMDISAKAIESMELFTQMEIYLLAILAIIIQIIVMYQPSNKEERA